MVELRNAQVLYIVGWQRSGTTVLGNALGSVPGALHTGELTYLFTPTHPAGNECGCGLPIDQCPVWSTTLDALTSSGVSKAMVNNARLASSRMRHVPRAYRDWKHREIQPAYSNYLSVVYQSLAQSAGARMIVDSSKSPGECLAAVAAPGVDVRILHVVRDPRACAYSTSRRLKHHGASPNSQQMRRKSMMKSSSRWFQVNFLADFYLRKTVSPVQYKMVRYEDLMSDPHPTLIDICTWAQLDPSSLPLSGDRSVTLDRGHTVMGNPNRFSGGTTVLELDAEWQRAMNRADILQATLPALPLMPRYRYRFMG